MSPKTIPRPITAYSGRRRPSTLVGALLVALVILLGLTFAGAINTAPERVDQLTIENPTEFELFIESRAPDRGWMPLVSVRPHQTFVIDKPIDKGPEWQLRVNGQGRAANIIVISRDELVGLGWRYVIPADVGNQLRALGAPASPGG